MYAEKLSLTFQINFRKITVAYFKLRFIEPLASVMIIIEIINFAQMRASLTHDNIKSFKFQ